MAFSRLDGREPAHPRSPHRAGARVPLPGGGASGTAVVPLPGTWSSTRDTPPDSTRTRHEHEKWRNPPVVAPEPEAQPVHWERSHTQSARTPHGTTRKAESNPHIRKKDP